MLHQIFVDSYDNLVWTILNWILSLLLSLSLSIEINISHSQMRDDIWTLSDEQSHELGSDRYYGAHVTFLRFSLVCRTFMRPITQRPRGQSSYASNRHDRPILHRSRSDNGLLRARERTSMQHFVSIIWNIRTSENWYIIRDLSK